ncbi:MAG: hypothetical protein JSR99_13980 [Proteobacteria bacterium]|nr:hypothetical protein [Pseudomonadota bacterium]
MPEFRDYFGRDHSARIRNVDGRRYFIKRDTPANARKDYLAYLLSRDTFNIPEVILPDEETRRTLALEEPCHLIRLCQDYSMRRLPIRDLTTAVAAELVFSLWIRRRDAHNCNRVFVNGVPMFFDFGAALDVQPGTPKASFFRAGPDSGYVGNWRLWRVPECHVVQTVEIRAFERGKPITLHPVHNLRAFWAAAENYVRVIQSYTDIAIERAINACGYNSAEAEKLLVDLLQQRDGISDGLRQIRRIMKIIDPRWPERSRPFVRLAGKLTRQLCA